MGAVAVGVMAAGSAINAISQLTAGDERAAELRRNAQIAENFARYTSSEGRYKAAIQTMRGGILASEAKARGTAYGADAASGGLTRILGTTRFMTELESAGIARAYDVKAAGYRVQAQSMGEQARIEHDTGVYGAAGTLLAGAGQVAKAGYDVGMWGQIKGYDETVDNREEPDLPVKVGNSRWSNVG